MGAERGRVATVVARCAPVAVLVLCILAAHLDAVRGTVELAGRYDNRDGAYPLRIEAARQWRAGHVPLWNPYKRAGMPLLADTTASAIYPGNLPFLLGSESVRYRTLDVVAVLHFILGGLFMYGFLRTIGVGAAAGVVGGLTYASSGTMTWLASYYIQMQNSAVWIPLIMTAVHRVIMTPANARTWVAVGALAVALQFFAGYPEYSVYGGLIAAGYALSLVRKGRLARPLLAVGAIYCAGMLLAAVQLLPSLELQAFARRPVKLGLEMFQLIPAAPWMISNWVVPGASAGSFFPPLGSYHLGVLAIVLMTAGALGRRAGRAFFVLLLVVGFLMAVGSATPVNALAYKLPLLGSFRHPFKHLLEIGIAAAVLVAFGMDLLFRNARSAQALAVLGALASVGVIVLSGATTKTVGMLALGATTAFTIAVLLDRARVALAIALAASIAGYRMNVAAYLAAVSPEPSADSFEPDVLRYMDPAYRVFVPRYLFQVRGSESMIGDYPTEFRMPALGGAGPFLWKPLADATGMVEEELQFRGDLFSLGDQTLPVLSCRYIIANRAGPGFYPTLDPQGYPPIREREQVRLLERRDALPRFRLVGFVECADAATVERALRSDGKSLADLALVDCADGYHPQADLAPAGERSVNVDWESGGLVGLTTKLPADRASFLVVSRADFPGWRAYTDGVEQRVRRVYGLVQGVELPPGTSRVVLEYRPKSFTVGATVSLVALVVLVGTVLRGRAKQDANA